MDIDISKGNFCARRSQKPPDRAPWTNPSLHSVRTPQCGHIWGTKGKLTISKCVCNTRRLVQERSFEILTRSFCSDQKAGLVLQPNSSPPQSNPVNSIYQVSWSMAHERVAESWTTRAISVPCSPFCEHRGIVSISMHFSRQVLQRGAKSEASCSHFRGTSTKKISKSKVWTTWLTWLHFISKNLKLNWLKYGLLWQSNGLLAMKQARKVSRVCCLNQTYPQQTFPGDTVHELLAQKVGAKCKHGRNLAKATICVEGLPSGNLI